MLGYILLASTIIFVLIGIVLFSESLSWTSWVEVLLLVADVIMINR